LWAFCGQWGSFFTDAEDRLVAKKFKFFLLQKSLDFKKIIVCPCNWQGEAAEVGGCGRVVSGGINADYFMDAPKHKFRCLSIKFRYQ